MRIDIQNDGSTYPEEICLIRLCCDIGGNEIFGKISCEEVSWINLG